MKKLLALVLALVMALSLVVTANAAPIKSSYNLSSNYFVDAVGWYFTNDVYLILRDDTNYELIFQQYVFGTTDPGLKGNQFVVYSGTYSCVESADDEACHFDITLETCEGIYMEQHGKCYGRNVLGYAMVLDTYNWTEYMTDITEVEGDEFLANHDISGLVFTVEDLREDVDDVTLENKIVVLPEYNFLISE